MRRRERCFCIERSGCYRQWRRCLYGTPVKQPVSAEEARRVARSLLLVAIALTALWLCLGTLFLLIR